MKLILDRRTTKGNSSENRQKFLKRVRSVVRDSMQDAFAKKSIKELGTDGHDITIDKSKVGKSLDEPHFQYDFGGDEKWVMPGNDQYGTGDTIEKPQGGGGGKGGKQASDSKEKSEDPFIVHITQEEFMKFFFEDLELPDLVRKDLSQITEFKQKNAGYTSSGTPSRLSVVRSMKHSLMRRLALQSALKQELNETQVRQDKNPNLNMLEEITELKRRIDNVPYIEELDLKFRNVVKENVPSTSATMVCIMDNSGSMGQREKTLSRKFFFLLYLFLTKKYKKIELIFIHHTTEAREVTEEAFFNMKETGGTLVSSALELTAQIIKDRNLSKTNLYICQCSDGDNLGLEDNQKCVSILKESVLPVCQYYSYIQIQPEYVGGAARNTDPSSLWTYFESNIKKSSFAQQLIYEDKDIYKVFRKLFEKKTKGAKQ